MEALLRRSSFTHEGLSRDHEAFKYMRDVVLPTGEREEGVPGGHGKDHLTHGQDHFTHGQDHLT